MTSGLGRPPGEDSGRKRGRPHRRRRLWRSLPGLAILGVLPTALIVGAARGQGTSEGRNLFQQSCASCHGPDARGTTQGPPLLGVGAAWVDFMLSTGRMPLADPGAQPTRQAPAFSPEEIDAIVAYVTSLSPGGQDIPSVNPSAGNVIAGRRTFVANCLACHGAAGQGASVGVRAAPPLDRATALQIAEAVRVGPGVMPRFGDRTIDRTDLDSLVRYVLSLRSQRDPGGLGLGHVGPVAEGFVGVLLGLGLIVLVIRFTGTRT